MKIDPLDAELLILYEIAQRPDPDRSDEDIDAAVARSKDALSRMRSRLLGVWPDLRNEIEDIEQEVSLKVWRELRLRRYDRERSRPRTWLRTIYSRDCASAARSFTRRKKPSTLSAQPSTCGFQHQALAEAPSITRSVIDYISFRYSEKKAAAIVLRGDGLPQKEIASILEIPEQTLSSFKDVLATDLHALQLLFLAPTDELPCESEGFVRTLATRLEADGFRSFTQGCHYRSVAEFRLAADVYTSLGDYQAGARCHLQCIGRLRPLGAMREMAEAAKRFCALAQNWRLSPYLRGEFVYELGITSYYGTGEPTDELHRQADRLLGQSLNTGQNDRIEILRLFNYRRLAHAEGVRGSQIALATLERIRRRFSELKMTCPRFMVQSL